MQLFDTPAINKNFRSNLLSVSNHTFSPGLVSHDSPLKMTHRSLIRLFSSYFQSLWRNQRLPRAKNQTFCAGFDSSEDTDTVEQLDVIRRFNFSRELMLDLLITPNC